MNAIRAYTTLIKLIAAREGVKATVHIERKEGGHE